MTRYFMRDTPLCQLEQQMMTPPNFKARGHGRYSPGFQYSSEDTECPYCINFRRNQPCPLKLCICLDERIAAGALNLNEFVRDCFFPEAGVQLLARLERNFTCCSISFFLNECHRERWQHWRERYYRMSGRNLAALFLLTAYEDTFEKEGYTVPARENAQVHYAARKELEDSILCRSMKNAESKKADGAPPQNGGQGMTEADDHVHPSDDSSLRT